MKKTVPVALVLAAAVALGACAGAPKAPAAGEKAVSAAPKLSEGQRIQKSIDLAEQARQENDRGKHPEALDLALQALELDAENAQAMLQAGRAYARLGKQAKAMTYLESALKEPSRRYEALVWIGITLRDGGEAGKSKPYFEQALEAQPNNGWAYRELANLLFWNEKDAAGALSLYRRSVELGSDDPWIYNDACNAAAALGDKEAAKGYYLLAKAKIAAGQGDDWIKGEVARKRATYE